MMKTLCVAVVVLGLTSVCQSASLACEKILKKVDKGPDVSGSWYLIAASSDSCLATALINGLLLLSVRMDVTPKDTPNVYDGIFKVKIFGHCGNESDSYYYVNNTIFDVDSSNAPYGNPDVLLQSGCPDCIVTKGEDEALSTLFLFSRRQTVTAAELKEFEAQAECLSWSKPLVLNSDHNYDNCSSLDEVTDDETSALQVQIYQRLKNYSQDIIACFVQDLVQNYVKVFKEFFETWVS